MAKPSQREEPACVSWEARRRRHGVARQRGGIEAGWGLLASRA